MAEVVLDRSGVLPVIGKLVTAAMPRHVAVDEKAEPGSLAGSGDHALVTGDTQWCPALRNEDVRALQGYADALHAGYWHAAGSVHAHQGTR